MYSHYNNISHHDNVPIIKLDYRYVNNSMLLLRVAFETANQGHTQTNGAHMKLELGKLAAVTATVIGLALGSASAFSANKDIVDTAVEAGQFKTLAAALGAAGLVDTLKGSGPFTVLAPTDAAFAKLPAGTVENLLKPENKAKLTEILTYHVVDGNVMAAEVVKLTEAKALNGMMVKVKVSGDTVMINDATVTSTDIAASNGVIHVIDTVLLPPAN